MLNTFQMLVLSMPLCMKPDTVLCGQLIHLIICQFASLISDCNMLNCVLNFTKSTLRFIFSVNVLQMKCKTEHCDI